MSFEDFSRILGQFRYLKILNLNGLGEPLLNPELPQMIKLASSRGISVGFNSSVTLLNREWREKLIKSGLSWLMASIDGASKETFEEIRVGADFKSCIDNLRSFVEESKTRQDGGPELRLCAVLIKSNLEELPQIVELAADLGASSLEVQRYTYKDPVQTYFNLPESMADEDTLTEVAIDRVRSTFAE